MDRFAVALMNISVQKFPLMKKQHTMDQTEMCSKKQTVKVVSLRARHEDAWGSGVTIAPELTALDRG
jgi:hypothetical protein